MIVYRDARQRTMCDGCYGLAPDPVPEGWALGRRVFRQAGDDDPHGSTVDVPTAICPDCLKTAGS